LNPPRTSLSNLLWSAAYSVKLSPVRMTMLMDSDPPKVSLFAVGASLLYETVNTTDIVLSRTLSENVYITLTGFLNAESAENIIVDSDMPEFSGADPIVIGNSPVGSIFLNDVGITR